MCTKQSRKLQLWSFLGGQGELHVLSPISAHLDGKFSVFFNEDFAHINILVNLAEIVNKRTH